MRSPHLPRGTASARLLLGLGVERGVAAETCLRGTRLTAARLADPLGEIGWGQECRLIENLAGALGDEPGLGLEAGRRHMLTSSGMLGFGAMSSATLRASLEFALRYQDLAFTLARASLLREGSRSYVALDVADVPPAIRRFVADQQLATLWTALPSLAGALPPSPRIELSFARPPDSHRYRELFGVEPEFGRPLDRLGLPDRCLDADLPQADAAALALCEQQCRELLARRRAQVGVAGLVRDRLSRAGGGVPSMAMVAADIHTTTRTLRRRLADEGTTFRAVDRAVRLERAEELLAGTDLPVEAIATQVGYATSSAFVHAFIRWSGVTPGARRHALRLGTSGR